MVLSFKRSAITLNDDKVKVTIDLDSTPIRQR